MRLGQLARKHDLPVQEIVDYLEVTTGEKFHPNAKLYDTVVTMVYDHFELMPASKETESKDTTNETTPLEIETFSTEAPLELEKAEIEEDPSSVNHEKSGVSLTPAEEIAMLGGDLADEVMQTPQEKPAKTGQVTASEAVSDITDEEEMQTDKLLELVESGEVSEEELKKIKRLKAPKKELAGLKVLGKIELPEPKKKEPKQEATIKRSKSKPELSEEEKESRRLRAKRKREQALRLEEKKQKEQEIRLLKRRKEAHYKSQLKQEKLESEARKKRQRYHNDPVHTDDIAAHTTPQAPTTVPKTVLRKLWKWLNS